MCEHVVARARPVQLLRAPCGPWWQPWCPHGQRCHSSVPSLSLGMLCSFPAQLCSIISAGAALLGQPLPEQQQPLVPAGAEGPRAIFVTGAKRCQSHPALCLAPHRHFSMAEVLADNKKLSASQALSRLFLFNLEFNLNLNLLSKS